MMSGRRLFPDDRLYLAELQHLLGGDEEARETLRRGRQAMPAFTRLEADLINPFVKDGDMGQWLSLVNRPYVAGGFAPLDIAESDHIPFERLRANSPRSVSGATVTVVVSSYQPDSALVAAVESILASSWRDIEVCVVDDCSPAGYEDVYERVAALDSRVRVHRLAHNGGTYACRNWALDHAKGTYITFHDSDDWMHPERIERQMTHLEAHPSLPANTTGSVRVTEDLRFTHYRTPVGKVCEPSLMFRREEMRSRVGYFDTVRKAADSEYRFRIARATGIPVPTLPGAPLTFQRVDANSLSGDEIHRDWIHVSRRIYTACWRQWHEDVRRPFAAPGRRAMYAPARLHNRRTPTEVDVVIAVPYSLSWGARSLGKDVASTIREFRKAGRSVALWPVETPWRSESRLPDMSPAWARVLNEHNGAVEVVISGDRITCRTFVISDPGLGDVSQNDSAVVSATKVVLVGKQSASVDNLVGDADTYVKADLWRDVPRDVL